ncbi:MAG: hypothetical protein U0V64_14385 [Cyclobacteriaceae bacterium]
MLKRGFSILLLTVLLAHLAGFYAYLAIRLAEIRREMLTELRDRHPDQLQSIHLTAAQLEEALVEEDEMKLNGRMYDIAAIQKTGDRVVVLCLHDEKEDSLLSLLDGIIQNATRDKKPVPPSVLGLLSLTAEIPSHLVIQVEVLSGENNTQWQPLVSSFQKSPFAPPPRG